MDYDLIVVGSGVAGSMIASELSSFGVSILMLEAGKFFNKYSYPQSDMDTNAQLYWGGGLEATE